MWEIAAQSLIAAGGRKTDAERSVRQTGSGLKKTHSEALGYLAQEWHVKRMQPCAGLIDAAQNVLNRMMYGMYLPRTKDGRPDLDEIEAKIGCAQPGDAFSPDMNNVLNDIINGIMNDIRLHVRADFDGVGDALPKYIDRMKDSVACRLCGDLSLGRLYPPREGQPPREWMAAFVKERLGDYPALRAAVEAVNGFSFGVGGYLTYEVWEALEVLDPKLYPIKGVLSLLSDGTMDCRRTAINLYDELDRRLVGASKRLKAGIVEICTKPSRAISAGVGNFTDRMLYDREVRRELEKLLDLSALPQYETDPFTLER